ncbi:hypothetical protein GCM10010393_43210 [Streptomyces gobitricini]|uniref:Uncharacterized protein n=1 Tax=Streptomyces gobitricini TaxID=68211 RepID=A0ABN3MTA9_9ACTN
MARGIKEATVSAIGGIGGIGRLGWAVMGTLLVGATLRRASRVVARRTRVRSSHSEG